LADGFDDGGERAAGGLVEPEAEDRGAEEDEGADDGGVARAGFILQKNGILAPVVADLDTGPVAADEGLPPFGGVFVGRETGDVVAGFRGGLSGRFDRAAGPYGQEGADERQADGEGIRRQDDQVPDLDSSVSGLGVDKKGGRPSVADLA